MQITILKQVDLYPTNSNKNTISFHMKDGVFKNSKKVKANISIRIY